MFSLGGGVLHEHLSRGGGRKHLWIIYLSGEWLSVGPHFMPLDPPSHPPPNTHTHTRPTMLFNTNVERLSQVGVLNLSLTRRDLFTHSALESRCVCVSVCVGGGIAHGIHICNRIGPPGASFRAF